MKQLKNFGAVVVQEKQVVFKGLRQIHLTELCWEIFDGNIYNRF